ncbi:MAG: hypothetical protein KAI17_20455 [Thiotrichaceae bacterium]|nr:hypothetical protein [Thiotrichaceae bacterium]
MKLRDYCSFYAKDGLFLPTGSYTVEEISIRQMEFFLRNQHKEYLILLNHSYPTHHNQKILK